MQKKLTKRLSLLLTVLLIFATLLISVACDEDNDTFAGNYKLITEGDRDQFVQDTLTRLEDLVQTGMNKYAVTGTLNYFGERDEGKFSFDVFYTAKVDGTKHYIQCNCEIVERDEFFKFDSILWLESTTMNAYYKITMDGETIQGKCNVVDFDEDIDEKIKMAITYVGEFYNIALDKDLLNMVNNSLTNKNRMLYSDGDKIKIVYQKNNTEDNKLEETYETYLIVGSNGNYLLKMTHTSNYSNIEEYSTRVIEPSTASVSMPDFE